MIFFIPTFATVILVTFALWLDCCDATNTLGAAERQTNNQTPGGTRATKGTSNED